MIAGHDAEITRILGDTRQGATLPDTDRGGYTAEIALGLRNAELNEGHSAEIAG